MAMRKARGGDMIGSMTWPVFKTTMEAICSLPFNVLDKGALTEAENALKEGCWPGITCYGCNLGHLKIAQGTSHCKGTSFGESHWGYRIVCSRNLDTCGEVCCQCCQVYVRDRK